MDEATWLTGTDPRPMLEFLRGRASDRQFRLFTCACVRRLGTTVSDERCRQAVEAAEHLADGLGGPRKFQAATVPVRSPTPGRFYSRPFPGALPLVTPGSPVNPGTVVCLVEALKIFNEITADCPGVVGEVLGKDREAVEYGEVLVRVIPTAPIEEQEAEWLPRAALVREIFGNPFRPVTLSPSVRAWNGGTVVRLAQAAYSERCLPEGTLDPAFLPVLADALEEAGCTDAEVLGHLRGPGSHYRGCWAVDLALAKN